MLGSMHMIKMPEFSPEGLHDCQEIGDHTVSCTLGGHDRTAVGGAQQNAASQDMGSSA